MFKLATLCAVAVPALLIAASANAETAKTGANGAYVEVGAGIVSASDQDLRTVNFTIGKQLTRSFAVEAEGQIGVSHETVSGVKVKVDYAAAAYAVGKLPITPNIDLVGRVGYMKAQVKAYVSNASATDSETGPAYGLGLRVFPTDGNSGVRVEYTHFDLSNDLKGDLYQISYIHRF